MNIYWRGNLVVFLPHDSTQYRRQTDESILQIATPHRLFSLPVFILPVREFLLKERKPASDSLPTELAQVLP
jgi:hypothetical protein